MHRMIPRSPAARAALLALALTACDRAPTPTPDPALTAGSSPPAIAAPTGGPGSARPEPWEPVDEGFRGCEGG